MVSGFIRDPVGIAVGFVDFLAMNLTSFAGFWSNMLHNTISELVWLYTV